MFGLEARIEGVRIVERAVPRSLGCKDLGLEHDIHSLGLHIELIEGGDGAEEVEGAALY